MQDQRNPTRRVMRDHRLAAHRECSLALKRRVIRCPSRTTGSCDEALPRSVMLHVWAMVMGQVKLCVPGGMMSTIVVLHVAT